MKFCVDCKNHVVRVEGGNHWCKRQTGRISLVTGQPEVITNSCEVARSCARTDCGPEGKFWEPKDGK